MSVRKFSSASISSAAIKSSKLWDQETFPGTYESISTAIVDSSGASSVEFTSIPSTYKHLQIRVISKSTRATVSDYLTIRFNNDTGTNYSAHNIYGDGSAANAASFVSTSTLNLERTAGANTANVFGVLIIDILDYANTNKYKTLRSLGGVDANTNDSNGQIHLFSGNWRDTSAITSIKFLAQAGSANFAQYSHFALYGIRGA